MKTGSPALIGADHRVIGSRPLIQAFTLVELLTVVAIIGILSAIVISAVGSVRQRARASQCQSNMRQIGMAVLTYAAENRTLPGPLYGRVSPAIMENNAKGRLAGFLAPVFTTKTIKNEVVMVPVMVCPGFAAERPDLVGVPKTADAIVYLLNTYSGLVPGHTGSVWGAPGAASPNDSPVRLINIENPARAWMLSDADHDLIRAWGYGGWDAALLAPSPVHGASRNRVYFDGHVAAVPLDEPGR